jgi:hypothetical protein
LKKFKFPLKVRKRHTVNFSCLVNWDIFLFDNPYGLLYGTIHFNVPPPPHLFSHFLIYKLQTLYNACRKRRLKWVATLPLVDINTEAWSSGMGVGRGVNPTL